jgi:NTE family protein
MSLPRPKGEARVRSAKKGPVSPPHIRSTAVTAELHVRGAREADPHGDPASAGGLAGTQTVLVLEGGGALGAYQVGVYQALHEAGLTPDWVIGTSIGAINAALIAGNPPAQRLARMEKFWQGMASIGPRLDALRGYGLGNALANAAAITQGIPGFFSPNPLAWFGSQARVGPAEAAYYRTAPLRQTLTELVDFERIAAGAMRLTVGAVNVESGQMRYFDSRREAIGADHVLASGALPPAFPAVQIGDEWFWDGGIYSNTPIEAVLDDRPRRSSLVFAVQLWHASGPLPQSIAEAAHRQKDIQYASRANSHFERQRELHRLRHVVRQLSQRLPLTQQADPQVRELTAWGCATTMHVVRLMAPRLAAEDQFKDLDFTAQGVAERRRAGYADAQAMLARAPWRGESDPLEGVIEHRVMGSGSGSALPAMPALR